MDRVYQLTVGSYVSKQDVQDSLMLAILAMECLYGSAQARLDLSHEFDPKNRTRMIGACSQVGQYLNRLFTGLLVREFGSNSFRGERLINQIASSSPERGQTEK